MADAGYQAAPIALVQEAMNRDERGLMTAVDLNGGKFSKAIDRLGQRSKQCLKAELFLTVFSRLSIVLLSGPFAGMAIWLTLHFLHAPTSSSLAIAVNVESPWYGRPDAEDKLRSVGTRAAAIHIEGAPSTFQLASEDELELARPDHRFCVRWSTKNRDDSYRMTLERIENTGGKTVIRAVVCREIWPQFTRDGTQPDGEWIFKTEFSESREVLSVTPLINTGELPMPMLKTVSLELDEEALAGWFIDYVDRQEMMEPLRAKAATSRISPTSSAKQIATDTESKRQVLRFVSDALRFQLGGELSGKATPPQPQEMAASLRWQMWLDGSDSLGSWVQFLLYLVFGFGIVSLFVRWELACRWSQWVQKEIDADSTVHQLYESPTGASSDAGVSYLAVITGYCEYALPAIGFLGTIAGLGAAFGTVGIVSEIQLLQKASLMGVLLDLGTAFSTTYIALLLGIVLTVLALPITMYEDRIMRRAEHYVGERAGTDRQETITGNPAESR